MSGGGWVAVSIFMRVRAWVFSCAFVCLCIFKGESGSIDNDNKNKNKANRKNKNNSNLLINTPFNNAQVNKMKTLRQLQL